MTSAEGQVAVVILGVGSGTKEIGWRDSFGEKPNQMNHAVRQTKEE